MDVDSNEQANRRSVRILQRRRIAYIAPDSPIALETNRYGRAKRAIRDDVLVYVLRS